MSERSYHVDWLCTGCYQPPIGSPPDVRTIVVRVKSREDAEQAALTEAQRRHRGLRRDRVSHCSGEGYVRLAGKIRVQ